VNGVAAARVADMTGGSPQAVEALRVKLAEESQKRRLIEPQDPTAREVTVMADKGLPYSVLRTVLTTASAAEIGKVSLAVIERERVFSGSVR
jgi:biopolymer transport protein ExbD